MQFNRITKKNKAYRKPTYSGEICSKYPLKSYSNISGIQTQIIPSMNSVVIDLNNKQRSINQNLSAIEIESDYLFSPHNDKGYLDINKRKTYRISNFENQRRKFQISLTKSKQISQYIIANKGNQINQTFESKSARNNLLIMNSSSGFRGRNDLMNNKSNLFSRNIGITLKMLFQKKESYQKNIKITRLKRNDKGGVVDLALPGLDKTLSDQSFSNKQVILSPKNRETSIVTIQRWWKNILKLFKRIENLSILIQSVYRGYTVRKGFRQVFSNKISETFKPKHKCDLFVLYLHKAFQLKIQSYKHHLFYSLMRSIGPNKENENRYQFGIQTITNYCHRMHFLDLINLMKIKLFRTTIQRQRYWKLKKYIRKWKNNTIKPEPLKHIKLRKTIQRQNRNNDKADVLLLVKGFYRWRKKTQTKPKKRAIVINKSKDRCDDSKPNYTYQNPQIENTPRLKKNRNKLLLKSMSSLDFKNSLIKKSYFIRWLKKTKIQPKKQIIKAKPKIHGVFFKGICYDIIDKIRKESNRRKLIKMFLHIRNCQCPTLDNVFRKLVIYSSIRFQVINAYASVIQSYYRMKQLRKEYLLKVVTKRTRRIITQTDHDINIDNYNYNISPSNSNQIHQSNREQYIYRRTRTTQLNPREVFSYLAKRYFIKSLAYVLMVSI